MKKREKIIVIIIFILAVVTLAFYFGYSKSDEEPKLLASPVSDIAPGYIIELQSDPLVLQEIAIKETSPSSLVTQRVAEKQTLLEQEHNQAKSEIFTHLGVSEISLSPPEVLAEYYNVFNGIALEITAEQAESIRDLPSVKGVYENRKVKINLDDSVPLINADDVWQLTDSLGQKLTGKGIKIGIIDSGVDHSHPDLGGCFGSGCKVEGGWDFHNNDNTPVDANGHGTHVAATAAGNGVLKGVAPDAIIYAFKVVDSTGRGDRVNVISAVDSAPNYNLDIISLSLGTICGGYTSNCGPNDPLSRAVDNAVTSGIVAVVAAGNSGSLPGSIDSPGTSRKAITVGASDNNDDIASYSSRGPVYYNGKTIHKPDVVAPGNYICAAQSSQDTIWQEYWDLYQTDIHCLDTSHISIHGTSMATPHVTGLAALLLQQNPTWTPQQVKDAIMSTAVDIGEGLDTQGSGRIDALAAVGGNPNPDPLAYWNFNGNSQDQTGNGYDATLHGATYAEGIDGQGLLLDGLNDYVQVLNDDFNFGTYDPFTIGGWIKTTNADPVNGWNRLIFDKYYYNPSSGTSTGYHLGLVPSSYGAEGTLGFWIYDGSTWDEALSTTPVIDGQWHYVTISKNSNSIKVYVDGIKEGESPINIGPGMDQVVKPFHIGSYDSSLSFFQGSMDDVKIWNRELSDSEILEEYNTRSVCPVEDTNGDCCIELNEIVNYIGRWISGDSEVSAGDAISAIVDYISGESKCGPPKYIISGDYDADGKDEIIRIFNSGKAIMSQPNEPDQEFYLINIQDNSFMWEPSDYTVPGSTLRHVVSGHFANLPGDQIVAVSEGGWAYMWSFANDPSYIYGNFLHNGASVIVRGDYLDFASSGDYDADGYDELLGLQKDYRYYWTIHPNNPQQTPEYVNYIKNSAGDLIDSSIYLDEVLSGDVDCDLQDELIGIQDDWFYYWTINLADPGDYGSYDRPEYSNYLRTINGAAIPILEHSIAGDRNCDRQDELRGIISDGYSYFWGYTGDRAFSEYYLTENGNNLRGDQFEKIIYGDWDGDGSDDLAARDLNGEIYWMDITESFNSPDCSAVIPCTCGNYYCESWEDIMNCFEDCATCAEKGGNICPTTHYCDGTWTAAVDTDRCCLGNCVCNPYDCSQMGWQCDGGYESNCNTWIDCGGCSGGQQCQNHQCTSPVDCSLLNEVVGFAAGVTGGCNGEIYHVTHTGTSGLGSFAYGAGLGNKWIVFDVSGTWSGYIDVASHTTIDGRGKDITIRGGAGGLSISGKTNVIVENINFDGQANGNDIESNDGIRIMNSNNVWIDHCTITDYGDGAIDITHGSHDVTVSWTKMHDHDQTMLIGASDSDHVDRVTLHHNYFKNTNQRNPRIRWAKVHAYNNYLKNWGSYGMAARKNSVLYAEKNYFQGGGNTDAITCESGGKVKDTGNSFNSCSNKCGSSGSFTIPYSYSAESASSAKSSVSSSAGATR